MTARSASVFALSRAYLTRALGVFATLAGLLVLTWAVGGALEVWSWLTAMLFALAAIAVVVAAVAAVMIGKPPAIFRLDDEGFQVKWVRGAGLTRGTWSQIRDVSTRRSAHGLVLVLVHAGSHGHTRVPLAVLNASPQEVEAEVRRRLTDPPSDSSTRRPARAPEDLGGHSTTNAPQRPPTD